MNPVKKISIVDRLSTDSYEYLQNMVASEFGGLILFGEKIGGAVDADFRKTQFISHRVTFINYVSENKYCCFTFSSQSKNKHSWSSYSIVNISYKVCTKKEYRDLLDKKTMLVAFNSLSTKFENLDVYGVKCDNYLLDEMDYSPFTKTVISNDSDCLIKLNLNEEKFIVVSAEDEKVILTLGFSISDFDDYIKMTRQVGGEHKGYRYKYTIE